jgi:hypothetical protein
MRCHGSTSWIYSHAISQNGQNQKFLACTNWKRWLGTRFYHGITKAKTEILQRMSDYLPTEISDLLGIPSGNAVRQMT